jgi:hypothetical protein
LIMSESSVNAVFYILKTFYKFLIHTYHFVNS